MPPPRGLVQQLDQLLHRRRWLAPGGRYLIACSGGADSVALLRLLHAVNGSNHWRWKLVVGHVNHGLRGRESGGDQRFVQKLAKQLGLPCRVRRVTVRRNCAGKAPEAAAREARFRALRSMARGADAVILAHHADDQAETVLMRILRGAGVRGLAGMAPRTRVGGGGGMRVIRPLLAIPRTALREYLAEIGQTWREDRTNAQTGDGAYLRNRIRAELMPLLEQYQPRVRETLGRLATRAREADAAVMREVRAMASELADDQMPRARRAAPFGSRGRKATESRPPNKPRPEGPTQHRRGLTMPRKVLQNASRAARGQWLRGALVELGVNADRLASDQIERAVEAMVRGRTGMILEFAGGGRMELGRDTVVVRKKQKKRNTKHETQSRKHGA